MSRHRCCTSNMRALWATFMLNTLFTIAQTIGATASNSLALLSDTGTMWVDSATYAVNLIQTVGSDAFTIVTSRTKSSCWLRHDGQQRSFARQIWATKF